MNRQRVTERASKIRAHMAEFGIVARVGLPQVKELLAVIADADDARLPSLARTCLNTYNPHDETPPNDETLPIGSNWSFPRCSPEVARLV